MLISYQKLYEGEPIGRVTLGLIYLRIPKTGVLKSVRLIGSASSITATWFFNVRIAGVAIFSGAGRLQFTPTDLDDVKTDLTTVVTQGDVVLLDLEQTGQGQLNSPITIIMEIEDGLPIEETLVYTTASLANLATENTTVLLGKSYRLHKIEVDRSSRVRGYLTAAYRTADASRPIGTDPNTSTEHGVIFDVNLISPNLIWDLAPVPNGTNRESSRTANIPVAIENRSGGSSTVQVTFTILKIEV